jgi:hypothetical protein
MYFTYGIIPFRPFQSTLVIREHEECQLGLDVYMHM